MSHLFEPSLPSSRSRRSFLNLTAAGMGTALLSALAAPLLQQPIARASGKAEALLLTCMDYRLMDEVAAYMQGRGLKDEYDHVVLAGGSLGATTDKKPEWNQTFWGHLEVSIALHQIEKVIVLDHRDCGAYNVLLNYEKLSKDPALETQIHTGRLQTLAKAIKDKYPKLEVELLLMALDGKVETIANPA